MCIAYILPRGTEQSTPKMSSVLPPVNMFQCLVSNLPRCVQFSADVAVLSSAVRSLGLCDSKCCFTCSAFLSLSCCCPRSIRESRRSLLPPSSSLSQRDAKAYRSVCQNQRCLGNPSRIPTVDQETGKWAVWGSMDGYAETQLFYY